MTSLNFYVLKHFRSVIAKGPTRGTKEPHHHLSTCICSHGTEPAWFVRYVYVKLVLFGFFGTV